jgi:cell division protein FtsB
MGNKRAEPRNLPRIRNSKPSRIKTVHLIQGLCVLLILLNCWLVYAVLMAPGGLLGLRNLRAQANDLERKIITLRDENQNTYERIRNFKTDQRAQERLVREQLGWVRENELVVEFVPESNNSP